PGRRLHGLATAQRPGRHLADSAQQVGYRRLRDTETAVYAGGHLRCHGHIRSTHPEERHFAMTLNPAKHLMVPNSDAEYHEITQVENTPLSSPVAVRVLAEGTEMILLEVTMPPGQESPPHVHDHESVGYIVRGRAQT